MKVEDIDNYSNIAIKVYLTYLIEALDKLDNGDFFGTEGWRHFVMGED